MPFIKSCSENSVFFSIHAQKQKKKHTCYISSLPSVSIYHPICKPTFPCPKNSEKKKIQTCALTRLKLRQAFYYRFQYAFYGIILSHVVWSKWKENEEEKKNIETTGWWCRSKKISTFTTENSFFVVVVGKQNMQSVCDSKKNTFLQAFPIVFSQNFLLGSRTWKWIW